MAEKLRTWPRILDPNSPVQKVYDWDLWLNGEIWQITQGEDFTGDVNFMRKYVNFAAKKRNLKVRIIIPPNTNTIILQVIYGLNGLNKK